MLEHRAAASMFFAHRSVGMNILDGARTVYESPPLPTPHSAEVSAARPWGNLLHMRIGKHGDPLDKSHEFDTLIRAGLGDDLDAAMLELCYADVREGTDVRAVFNAVGATGVGEELLTALATALGETVR